eukprot:NODE_3453_length_552_cov_492.143141_g2918_i0.p3 GENE.NODE_3453_length_552_cov_492.143141_g2918_i0~~NODE_3453_length_552_cov_492.143141_g2918_i0.p3  ORF type:complete len:75 (-),score=28.45 NODE_3453_length_552_cov_492.143141_g2918_i0:84-308(-)
MKKAMAKSMGMAMGMAAMKKKKADPARWYKTKYDYCAEKANQGIVPSADWGTQVTNGTWKASLKAKGMAAMKKK